MRTKYANLVGKTIGQITIKEFLGNRLCRIQCGYCGKEKDTDIYRVANGRTKSCGCSRYLNIRSRKGKKNKKFRDLTGQRFGKLTVLKIDENPSNKQLQWICKCDCGNEKSFTSRGLRHYYIKSCGCLQREIGKNNKNWKGYEEISGTYWKNLLYGAKKRDLNITVSIQDIWKQFLEQKKKCALTGLDLTFNKRANDTTGNASLDRIDSSKGYVKGNIQWIDKRVNQMKNNFSLQEFLFLCKLITQNNI